MITLKRLYLIAGFDDADVEKRAAELQRQFSEGTVRFLARPYPVRSDKRAVYLKELVKSANDIIFNSKTATNFCRKQDQPCSIEPRSNGDQKKHCEVSGSIESGCARRRPQLVVVMCADQIFADVFDKLGRGVLILRQTGPKLPSIEILKETIDAFEPVASSVVSIISNRAKSLYAPLVPYQNFQCLGAHPIAQDIQASPARFDEILQQYHTQLYCGSFVNPKKRQIRGAYMFDADTAFQQDRLHSTVQIIGAKSRENAFHLLNAYHVYGVKTDPGFHFDVMNANGNSICHTFTDILTGKISNASDEHLNLTPCDRLL